MVDSIVGHQAMGQAPDILEEDIHVRLLTMDIQETGRDVLAVDSVVGRRVKRISGSRSVLSRIIFDLEVIRQFREFKTASETLSIRCFGPNRPTETAQPIFSE